jgi:drug/metabolite transporter (DMT)-like permease
LRPAAAHAVLFAGLVCVSTSGPFLVMSGVDPYAIVLWRMGLSAPIFLGYAAARGELRWAPGETGRFVVGACLLALHFVLWVKAFDLTDFASNLLLLVAQPIMAAIVAVRQGERSGSSLALPLLLATLGLLAIAGGDFALGRRALLGDLLCVVAGVAITFFYVVTRRARAAMPISTFMGATFALGAALVAPLVWLTGVPLGSTRPHAALWMAALVLVTTVAGHGLMNLAARTVSLFTLNMVIVLEPAIAIGLGALLFGATISATTALGGALLCAAVVASFRRTG